MVRERFDESFERLREQSNRLAATERSSQNFDEIVEQRVELDRRRDDVTAERKNIVSRFEPPAPDVVERPDVGASTKWFGKLVAVVSVAMIALAAILAFSIVRTIGDGFPLELQEVVETVDTTGGCRWRVEATIRNDSDTPIQVDYVQTVLDRDMIRGTMLADSPTIAPGASGTIVADWNVLNAGVCPAVDDIGHGNLIITLVGGTTVSRSI